MKEFAVFVRENWYKMNNQINIPDRFRRVIVLHLVKNLLQQDIARVPLLLGIHGPSGYGKTYQCECVLNELGAKTFLISGGELESSNAGEPAQLLRNKYLQASRCLEKGESQSAVILINDIDTGLGSWGDMVQYTINRQTVFGELMHFVDYPNSVEGRETKRIPIIFTGNDFTKLYEPLVRAGRMTAFEWRPLLEEKVRIVTGIFPEISEMHCQYLVKEFEAQPIAFFSHLRSSLVDEILWQEIQNNGGAIAIIKLLSKQKRKIDLQKYIHFERLLQVGKELVKSGQLVNHLQGN